MDERQKLQQLFLFDLWSNRKLTDLIIEKSPFKQQVACAAFVSHIINAHKIWFSRVVEFSVEDDLDTWTEYEPGELKKEARKSTQMWLDLIGDHDVDLDTVIVYANSKGMEYRNSIWQICNHLVIHGQHHRAQISLFLKNCDINPPSIDYIHYARTEEVN